MKKFICQIIVFSLLFVLICTIPLVVFEKRAKDCTTRPPYSSVNFANNSKNIDADLIVIGNSRAECSYNDSILSAMTGLKCVNLGWAGYPFDYQYNVMFKTYIKQNKKPKYIMVEVAPWAFFDYVNPIYIIELLPYINQPEFQFYVELCPELSWIDKSLFVKYAGKLNKVRKELVLFKSPIHKTEKVNKRKWNSNYITGSCRLECDSAIIRVFNTFIDECLGNDIQLILICSPIHLKDGASHFDMDGFWKIINSSIKNKDIKILDYENLYGNDTSYFQDPMHLDDGYARDCFTKKVAHDLDSLGILQN